MNIIRIYLISLVVVGLVLGALGRLIVPGPNRIGLWATLAVGLGGAILGGLIGGLIGLEMPSSIGQSRWPSPREELVYVGPRTDANATVRFPPAHGNGHEQSQEIVMSQETVVPEATPSTRLDSHHRATVAKIFGRPTSHNRCNGMSVFSGYYKPSERTSRGPHEGADHPDYRLRDRGL